MRNKAYKGQYPITHVSKPFFTITYKKSYNYLMNFRSEGNEVTHLDI